MYSDLSRIVRKLRFARRENHRHHDAGRWRRLFRELHDFLPDRSDVDRQSLAENHGMLFVFTEAERHGMWMMNTNIPLSVAFLDKDGIILNISDMMPHTVTPHRSVGPAKYALEVNLGWFRKRNVKSGSRITGLKKVPGAE